MPRHIRAVDLVLIYEVRSKMSKLQPERTTIDGHFCCIHTLLLHIKLRKQIFTSFEIYMQMRHMQMIEVREIFLKGTGAVGLRCRIYGPLL